MYLSVAIILAIALASCQAFVSDKVELDLPIETEMYANADEGRQFVAFLEKFKHTMQTGDTKIGVPQLDPFRRSQMEINNDELVKMKAKLRNVRGVGFSNYRVKKGDFSSSKLTANATLLWDQISIMTNYNATGKTLNNTDFWGNGTVAIVMRDFEVTVNTKLTVKNKRMAVSSLSFKAHLKTLAFQITGLYDSVEASVEATRRITMFAPQWIEDHRKEVSHLGGRLVTDMLNKYLKNFTLKDFLNMIKG